MKVCLLLKCVAWILFVTAPSDRLLTPINGFMETTYSISVTWERLLIPISAFKEWCQRDGWFQSTRLGRSLIQHQLCYRDHWLLIVKDNQSYWPKFVQFFSEKLSAEYAIAQRFQHEGLVKNKRFRFICKRSKCKVLHVLKILKLL